MDSAFVGGATDKLYMLNILMFPADREWFRNPGASNDALHALREHAGINLPDEYYQLLAYSNGGEGSLPISPFNFCLDTAEYATKNKLDKNYEEFFPGFFVFGTSGGGDYIAFDHIAPS